MTAVGNHRSRREQKKLEKRERIRAAAWELFTTQGYAATTTEAVAKKARVAKGTLFLYAKDKPDLLHLVFHDRLRAVVDAQLASLPRKAPLLERLMHVFRALFRMYSESPAVAAEFIASLPGARGPNAQAVHALTMAFYHQLAGLVSDAQARGEVRKDVPPMLAANNFFALYSHALLSWILTAADLDVALESILRPSLELSMRGLVA